MSGALATSGHECPVNGGALATSGFECYAGGVIITATVVVELQGVVEDGGESGANVPANPRRALRVNYGETVTLRLSVFHRSGAPFDLTQGAPSIQFVARRGPEGEIVMRRTATLAPSEGRNRADVVLTADDYRRLRAAGERLVYDVFLSDGGIGRAAIVPLSSLVVGASANPLP